MGRGGSEFLWGEKVQIDAGGAELIKARVVDWRLGGGDGE